MPTTGKERAGSVVVSCSVCLAARDFCIGITDILGEYLRISTALEAISHNYHLPYNFASFFNSIRQRTEFPDLSEIVTVE